eukprot:NODE_815_length_3734_cov_0.660523.p4 type:complete len:135 gc:universal NODE_815_length_3734_cov_0.660523:2541-2137(-)
MTLLMHLSIFRLPFIVAIQRYNLLTKDHLRIEDVFFSIKHCINSRDVETGRLFFNLLTKYAHCEIYAHEMAILEESLDATWRLKCDNDCITIPELSCLDVTINSFKSRLSVDYTSARFDPNISISHISTRKSKK